MIELTSKKLIKAIAASFKEEEGKDIEQAEIIKENDFTYLKFPDGKMFCVAIYDVTEKEDG